jgi:cell pole-organizing protein PopZ
LLHTHTGSEEQKIALEAMITAPPPDVSALGAADEAANQTNAKARAAAAVKKNVSWALNNKVDSIVSTDPNPQAPADPLADLTAPVAATTDKKSKRKATTDPTATTEEPEIKWSRGVVDTGM